MHAELGGLTDPLLGLLRLFVAGHTGQLDQDPVGALADQRGLGDTEGIDTTAQDFDGLVDVLGRRLGRFRPLGLEDELRATTEIEAQIGLRGQREGQAPAEKTEDEEKTNEGAA